MMNFTRACLLIGAAINLFVGTLCLFFQPALAPLLDVPVRDPSATLFFGGELIVVGLLYIVIFSNPRKYQTLFLLVALDQFFAGVLPGIEILRGHVPSTLKTVGPIPFSFTLCGIFLWAATADMLVDRRTTPV